MTAIFPSLPGLGWSVMKAPRFATRIQKAISGRELRVLDQPYPIWVWTLTFTVLRDEHDTRGPAALGAGYDELRTLAGFFLQQQGSFGAFLFDDPSDASVAGQLIGTGNSSTTVFQLVRTFGGFTEPITAPNVVSAIYFNGITQSSAGYSIDSTTGLVTFTAPPPTGVAVTADFTYRFLVRFADDTAEFDNFMYQLWQLKQIKLQSIIGSGVDLGMASPFAINWDYLDLPPTAGQPVLRYTFGQAVSLPAALLGSIGNAGTAATAQTIFDIAKNGGNFATMTFAASASTATFAASASSSFVLGDVLTIIPRTSDASLASLSGALTGTTP